MSLSECGGVCPSALMSDHSLSADVVVYANMRGELGGDKGMMKFPLTIGASETDTGCEGGLVQAAGLALLPTSCQWKRPIRWSCLPGCSEPKKRITRIGIKASAGLGWVISDEREACRDAVERD